MTTSMPQNLPEEVKHMISIGEWDLYKHKNRELYLLHTGEIYNIYFLISRDGSGNEELDKKPNMSYFTPINYKNLQ